MLVTNPAPDFTATAVMPDNSFKEDFNLSDLQGKYVVLFFYPLDFTFVCPTEIMAFSEAKAEFDKRGAEVLGCSIDSQFVHKAWVETDYANGGLGGSLDYALLADVVLSLDDKNPVLAGRLASLFNGWARYDTGRQRLMKHELERILAKDGLSKNTFEIVSRALD